MHRNAGMGRMGLTAVVLTACAAGALGQSSVSDDGFAREGGMERRIELAKIETKAFSEDMLEGAEPLNDLWAEALEKREGRVLVVTTWGMEDNPSRGHAQAVANLAREYPQRIVAVGIYEGDDAEQAKAAAQQMGFAAAHDPTGEVAPRFGLDEVSDMTLVDHAGNIRIADIELADFSAALGALDAESAEQARADLSRREAFVDQAAENMERAAEQRAAMGDVLPDDELPAPESAYAEADWPSPVPQGRYSTDLQGDPLPPGLESSRWLRMPTESLDDRVLVLDFWATWCGPCHMAEPGVVEAMKKHDGKVAVIGVSNVVWNQESAERVDTFLTEDDAPYSAYAHDTSQALWNAFGIRSIPHVAIVSTDGVVRWQGNANDPAFFEALDATVSVDPGFDGE